MEVIALILANPAPPLPGIIEFFQLLFTFSSLKEVLNSKPNRKKGKVAPYKEIFLAFLDPSKKKKKSKQTTLERDDSGEYENRDVSKYLFPTRATLSMFFGFFTCVC